VLYDNVVESGDGFVKLINRGDWGGGHGWGSAHSVSWRFNKASQVQKPPTGQNYGVTDIGSFDADYKWKAGRLVPEPLYEAQLCERLAQRAR
jgi:hypothetical protein